MPKKEEQAIDNYYTVKLVQAEDTACIEQLLSVKQDAVHPVPSNVDDFIKYRVGKLSDNKQSWVLVNQEGEISAVLYTFRDTMKIHSEEDLSGNMQDILSVPVKSLSATARSVTFYSITSFFNGAGFRLIDEAYAQYTDKKKKWPVVTTLSPLRGFARWASENAQDKVQGIRCDEQKLKSLALEFLVANENKVQKFHMRNGAYIGDIKLEANKRGSRDDLFGMNVMVNYVYSKPDEREDNKLAYQEGFLTLAWHLSKQPCVARRSFEPKPPRPWRLCMARQAR